MALTISALRFIYPARRTPYMDARDAEIIRRRQAGEYPGAIKKTLNTQESVVYNVLRLARLRGVEFPKIARGAQPRRQTERDTAVLRLYAEGHQYRDIAERMGMPKGTIGTIIHQYAKAGIIKLRSADA